MYKKEHTIIGYTDSISEITVYKGKKFYRFDEIKSIEYDKIIITIQNKNVVEQIIEKLILEGIELGKIIPFSMYAETQLYLLKIGKTTKKYRGIVLGNSHAKFGLPERYFTDNVINLACPSQDIYYNYYVLKECLTKHKVCFTDLKYIVFDLYDYNCFNIDVSRAKEISGYIKSGGVITPHNFLSNSNFSKTFTDYLTQDLKIIKNETVNTLMNTLFYSGANARYVDDEKLYIDNARWDVLSEEKEILPHVVSSNMLLNRYEDTIKENVLYLEKMIKEIKTYNPEIKIIITMLPRYIAMEKEMLMRTQEWKKEFEYKINYLKETYGVYYLNFKDNTEISTNSNFYYDGAHLNARGGICMVSILDEEIRRIFKG